MFADVFLLSQLITKVVYHNVGRIRSCLVLQLCLDVGRIRSCWRITWIIWRVIWRVLWHGAGVLVHFSVVLAD